MDAFLPDPLGFHGIGEMDRLGFRGQGVNILVFEVPETGHADRVEASVRYMAPEANVLRAWFNLHPFHRNDLIRFIVEENIHIVNISLAASGYPEEFLRTLDEFIRRGLLVFSAAGNEGDRGPFGLASDVGIMVGAASLQPDGTVRKDESSAISRWLDFMFLKPPPELAGMGTSFASPMAAGFAARILSGYGGMHQKEMYWAMRALALDMAEPGWDRYTGWGIPVFREDRMDPVYREILAFRKKDKEKEKSSGHWLERLFTGGWTR